MTQILAQGTSPPDLLQSAFLSQYATSSAKAKRVHQSFNFERSLQHSHQPRHSHAPSSSVPARAQMATHQKPLIFASPCEIGKALLIKRLVWNNWQFPILPRVLFSPPSLQNNWKAKVSRPEMQEALKQFPTPSLSTFSLIAKNNLIS